MHLATEQIFEEIARDSGRQFTVHVSCSQVSSRSRRRRPSPSLELKPLFDAGIQRGSLRFTIIQSFDQTIDESALKELVPFCRAKTKIRRATDPFHLFFLLSAAASSRENLQELIRISEKNRITRATAGNAQSSRSHSILTLVSTSISSEETRRR